MKSNENLRFIATANRRLSKIYYLSEVLLGSRLSISLISRDFRKWVLYILKMSPEPANQRNTSKLRARLMNPFSWSTDDWYVFVQVGAVVFTILTISLGKRISASQSVEIVKLKTDLATAQKGQSEAALKFEQFRRRSLPRDEAFNTFAFRNVLRAHPPARAMIVMRTSEREAVKFADRLRMALWTGHWKEVPSDPSFEAHFFTGGISLAASTGEEPGKTTTPIGILGTAFKAAGIDAGGTSVRNNMPNDLVVIEIFPQHPEF